MKLLSFWNNTRTHFQIGTFWLMKRRLMQPRHPIKAGKFITAIVMASFILSPYLHHDSGEKLIYNPFHRPEPHCEEFQHSDYNELYREKGTAAVTGTKEVLTFGENNSKYYSF